MPNSEILTWLNSHHDARLHVARVDTSKLRDWLDDMDASTRSGVRRAWMVGRVLNAERDRVPHGEVEEWEKARAKQLNRNVRTLQLYRYVAEAVEDPKIVTALRICHADLGLKGLAQVIRRKRRKLEPRPPRTVDKSANWEKRAERLLKAVPASGDQVALLQAHLEAVQAKLKELKSGPTVREATGAYVKRLETAGRDELVPAARWTTELLVRHFSPRFPVHTLTTRHVREFLRVHAGATHRDRRTRRVLGFPELYSSLATAIDWWKRRGWCPSVKALPRAPPVR